MVETLEVAVSESRAVRCHAVAAFSGRRYERIARCAINIVTLSPETDS
jgi:hypothetical protein